jgi:hypothetical protein
MPAVTARLTACLASLALLSPARAQVVPSEPAPAESAPELGPQAARNPAASDPALGALLRRLAEPRVVLPTWQEVREDRLRRGLTGPSSDASAVGAPPLFVPPRSDAQRRTTRETVEATLSRPLPRLGLGAGWSSTTFSGGNEALPGFRSKYAFLSVDLSRCARPARLLSAPIVDHSITEVGPAGVRVETDERVVDSLKLPSP